MAHRWHKFGDCVAAGFRGRNSIWVAPWTSTLDLQRTTSQQVNTRLNLQLLSGATIEHIIVSSFDDMLAGNTLGNALTGGQGDDTISGGLGDDVYIFSAAPIAESDLVNELNGQGRDTLSFTTLASNLTLNLGITTPQVVHQIRTLKLNSMVEFENAAGGTGNDILSGNNRNNVLVGNEGDDQLL